MVRPQRGERDGRQGAPPTARKGCFRAVDAWARRSCSELDGQAELRGPEIRIELLRDQVALLVAQHDVASVQVDAGLLAEGDLEAAAQVNAKLLLGLVWNARGLLVVEGRV